MDGLSGELRSWLVYPCLRRREWVGLLACGGSDFGLPLEQCREMNHSNQVLDTAGNFRWDAKTGYTTGRHIELDRKRFQPHHDGTVVGLLSEGSHNTMCCRSEEQHTWFLFI